MFEGVLAIYLDSHPRCRLFLCSFFDYVLIPVHGQLQNGEFNVLICAFMPTLLTVPDRFGSEVHIAFIISFP